MNNSAVLLPAGTEQGSRPEIPPSYRREGRDKWFTLLSTSFPPKGGSGVQRPYYQSKFLSELGWNVNVITVSSSSAIRDPSFVPVSEFGVNVTEIHPGIVQSRLRLLEKIDRRLRRSLFFPDEFRLWASRVANETMRQHRRHHVVMASVGSPSALLALNEVKNTPNGDQVRTVVDFRDFWALNQRVDVPDDRRGEAKQNKRELLERSVLRTVDGVVVVSEAYKRRAMAAYPWLLDEQVLVVENGYVESDFDSIERRIVNNRPNAAFTIRYTGFLLKDHNPELFFAGLKIVKKKNPELYRDIRFEYFGGGAAFVAELASIYEVSDICSFQGYVPHSQAIEIMLTADALYLPFARGEGTIGGKTYEYIRSGRPLIPTLTDCDEPRQILAKFGVAEWVAQNDFEKMAAMLTKMATDWRSGCQGDRASSPMLESIERSSQTRHLSNWLDILVAGPTRKL
jgi:glycosyltransferase involved in cell wall biosynthesis